MNLESPNPNLLNLEGLKPHFLTTKSFDSTVVSISACHAEDPGSIPGRNVLLFSCLSNQTV